MKKYVVLFCLVAMLALSGSALAAGPDVKDFSTEQMEKCGVTQSFPNKDLKECISKITGYIQQNI